MRIFRTFPIENAFQSKIAVRSWWFVNQYKHLINPSITTQHERVADRNLAFKRCRRRLDAVADGMDCCRADRTALV